MRACADAHDGTPRFVREGFKFRNFTVPTACYHCADPVCMIGCPTGAISRPLGHATKWPSTPSLCIGCGNCVNRCPWGNILTTTHQQESGTTIRAGHQVRSLRRARRRPGVRADVSARLRRARRSHRRGRGEAPVPPVIGGPASLLERRQDHRHGGDCRRGRSWCSWPRRGGGRGVRAAPAD